MDVRQEGMEQEKKGAEYYLQSAGQLQSMYDKRLQIPGKMMAADTTQK